MVPALRHYCRNVTLIWALWLVVNAIIAAYLALAQDDAAWVLSTGLLSSSCPAGFLPRMAGPAQHRRPTAAMSAGPLAGLLLDEATADRPVAISDGHVIALRRFRADVAATAARLAAAGCRSGLSPDDAYWAAVGLFALAHGGAAAILAQLCGQRCRRSPAVSIMSSPMAPSSRPSES